MYWPNFKFTLEIVPHYCRYIAETGQVHFNKPTFIENPLNNLKNLTIERLIQNLYFDSNIF